MSATLTKQIKKQLYGKAQTVQAIFPPGFGNVAFEEVSSILNNLWFKQKFSSECVLLDNAIRIQPIHLFAVTELLMRSQCLSDIRLIIFEGKSFGKNVFEKQCEDIPWDFYITNKMSIKIKVNSIASNAFHESGLKQIITKVLKNYTADIVSGESTQETTCVYVDLYKNKLTLSISLAGDALYKRGYRGKLSASAPLREDAAFCCIKKSLQFAKQDSLPEIALIPFSGTGTFAFEYLQQSYQFSPALFNREYALQAMPLFRQENFQYLLKKAREYCLFNNSATHPMDIVCIDNSKNANAALLENLENFKHSVLKNHFSFPDNIVINTLQNSFLETDVSSLIPNNKIIFMPFNPPYGIRLKKNADIVALYKNIALKINTITKTNPVLGFILCPNEETWSIFLRNLQHAKTETYHFTQGGIDIRVCQFYTII